MNDFSKQLKEMFAYYGFTECPLSDEQIKILEDKRVSVDEAYHIGCDWNAGITHSFLE